MTKVNKDFTVGIREYTQCCDSIHSIRKLKINSMLEGFGSASHILT